MSGHQNIAAPKVFLSPFVLSTVMLDNSNSPGDQEGFLLGKTYKSVRSEINDQTTNSTEEDLMISVYSAYPCGSFLSFYNSKGEIDIEFIKNCLGDRINCVIGWYRFRRNVPPYPSAREAIVQKHLMNIFAENIVIGENYFVFGVFGSSTTENFATHSYDYAFYIERLDRFFPLVLSMLNLIDTKTKYRSGSLASSFVNSQTFDSVLNINWSFESCWQTEDNIQQMHNMLRDKCSNLAEELAASESVNASIENDIKALEAELQVLAMSENQSNELGEANAHQENIPPRYESKNIKPSRKRYWSELVDYESEKQHPVFGKYFEQSRSQEPENTSQASSEASDGGYYILPPQKKFKVLQEHKRVIDHDYSSASDEDSHKYAQDADDDRADELDGVSLPSETEEYVSTDDSKSIHDVEIEVPSNISIASETEGTRSICLDNRTNVILGQKGISPENTETETIGALGVKTLDLQPGSPCVSVRSEARISPDISDEHSPVLSEEHYNEKKENVEKQTEENNAHMSSLCDEYKKEEEESFDKQTEEYSIASPDVVIVTSEMISTEKCFVSSEVEVTTSEMIPTKKSTVSPVVVVITSEMISTEKCFVSTEVEVVTTEMTPTQNNAHQVSCKDANSSLKKDISRVSESKEEQIILQKGHLKLENARKAHRSKGPYIIKLKNYKNEGESKK